MAETAYHKVLEVYQRLSGEAATGNVPGPDVVIGADTMVTMDGKMYGKPKTPEVAFQMLSE